MFDISLAKLLVVLLVALLVIGPKELPIVAYHLGKLLRKAREFFLQTKQFIDDKSNHEH